jgi:hypothetical protein
MAPRPTTTTKTYDTILLLIQMCIFEGLFAGKRFRLVLYQDIADRKVSGHR